jgi:anti-sigma factor RsiW
VISCRRVAALLDHYAAEELSAPESQRLEWHLHRCPLCASEVESYLRVIRIVRALPPSPLPPGLWDRLRLLVEQVRLRTDRSPLVPEPPSLD